MKTAIKIIACVAAVCLLFGCAATDERLDETIALAQAKLENGDFDAAEDSFKLAAEISPSELSAYEGLVKVYEGKLLSAADAEESAVIVGELIGAYEKVYAYGVFGAKEYIRISELYALQGETAKQRDALERAIRLEPTQETADKLFSLVVDAASDEKSVTDCAAGLFGFFADKDADGAAAVVLNNEWFKTMMPKLDIGCRRYVMTDADTEILKIEVGYEGGERITRAWFLNTQSQEVQTLRASNDTLCYAVARLSGGAYSGVFKSEMADATTGGVYFTEGVFAENICVQTVTENAYLGDGESDISALWSGRSDLQKTAYSGEFSPEGKTNEKQQAAVTNQNGIVYAYSSNAKKYLFICPEEPASAEDYVFTSGSFLIPEYPEW